MRLDTKQMKLMAKAYERLEAIEDERSLKKNRLTLVGYRIVIDMYNELVSNGTSETFVKDAADWFERLGFKVTRKSINYKVTL